MTGSSSGREVIVTGATSLVGCWLVPLLANGGFRVQAISRRSLPGRGQIVWRTMDLRARAADRGLLGRADVVFHTAPLYLLPEWVATFAELGVRRLVAFSSTSLRTKESSADPRERETAGRLAESEAAVRDLCRKEEIGWTLFRPTLIYGEGRDRNVSEIARFIRRFGFFPLAGEGRGRRQPVHAEDLARACLAVLDNEQAIGRVYDLPGGETLTYAEMVSRIARGVGRAPRLLRVPVPVLRGALAVLRRLPSFAHLSPEVASRMDADLIFDAEAARRDFGYDPRPFRYPDEGS